MRRLLSLFFIALYVLALLPVAAGAQSGFNRGGPFLGIWCVEEDPSRRASITTGQFGLTLSNEYGSNSTGVITGPFSRQLLAPQWNLIHGTLSSDGTIISWSNNTYWTRCQARINLQGTWYLGGVASQPCRIVQRGGALQLLNEAGQIGNGTFTSRNQIEVIWGGILFYGTISVDQNRIDWVNGTFWTR